MPTGPTGNRAESRGGTASLQQLLACRDLPVFIAVPKFKKLPMNRRVLFSGNLGQEVS